MIESDSHGKCPKGMVLFTPKLPSMPQVLIKTAQGTALHGKRVVVMIDTWTPYSELPQGHIVQVLGEAGTISTETEALLVDYAVPPEK